MVLNSTSGNLFNLDENCREVCEFTKNMCTVFTLNDLGRDKMKRYKGLSVGMNKVNRAETPG